MRGARSDELIIKRNMTALASSDYELKRKKKVQPAVNQYSRLMGFWGRGRVAGGQNKSGGAQ